MSVHHALADPAARSSPDTAADRPRLSQREVEVLSGRGSSPLSKELVAATSSTSRPKTVDT
ncbi:hypothetical protein [Nonomuraea dietziae]|uniref:hypothetical protein n=1 Tax=Nonomuraea dietziae TaxID=65515 RepID=UPI0031CE2541